MSHTRRRGTLAALAIVTLIGAGCSDAPPETGAGAARATGQGKALRFAACMRDHGVREFPDPDASGSLTIDGIVNGSSLDPDGPAFEQAMGACRSLQPPGFTGRKRSPEQQSGALTFAQCIREHGVEDFPDPAAGEPLVDTRRIPSTDEPGGMDVLNAAMQQCGEAAAAAGVQP